MAQPTNPMEYPTDMLAIAQALLANPGVRKSIPFDSMADAKNLRFKWYNYLKACERALVQKTGLSALKAEEILFLRRFVWSLSVADGTYFITIRHDNATKVAKDARRVAAILAEDEVEDYEDEVFIPQAPAAKQDLEAHTKAYLEANPKLAELVKQMEQQQGQDLMADLCQQADAEVKDG